MRILFWLRAAILTAILAALVFFGIPYLWNSPRRFGGGEILFIAGWFFVAGIAASVVVLLAASLRWVRRKSIRTQALRVAPEIPFWTSRSNRSHRRVPLITEIPNFGLYGGWLLNTLMFIFVIRASSIPTGLMVRMPSRYVAARPRVPQSESLGVYAATGGRFYVNGQLVPREQLRARLQDELGRRTLWIVYFEADDEVSYGEVVYAVDTIRGLGAQPYWVTPRVREELKHDANP